MDLIPSQEYTECKGIGDIPLCVVWAILFGVWGCRINTIQQAAYVIKDLSSRDLCYEIGECSPTHIVELLKVVAKCSGATFVKIDWYKHKYKFHAFVEHWHETNQPMQETESLLIRGYREEDSIGHVLCVRETQLEDNKTKFTAFDQIDPKGNAKVPCDWMVDYVVLIESPKRPTKASKKDQ